MGVGGTRTLSHSPITPALLNNKSTVPNRPCRGKKVRFLFQKAQRTKPKLHPKGAGGRISPSVEHRVEGGCDPWDVLVQFSCNPRWILVQASADPFCDGVSQGDQKHGRCKGIADTGAVNS